MRIKWNIRAFETIRRFPGVKARLKKEAEAVAQAAGRGYIVKSGEGLTRSRAAVIAGTAESARDNSKNNSLLKALYGRGE